MKLSHTFDIVNLDWLVQPFVESFPEHFFENVVPKNVVKEINSFDTVKAGDATSTIKSSDYHPVRYRFIVYQELDNGLSAKSLNEFTSNLVKEYRAKFTSTFQKAFDKDAYNELLDFDSYDYSYQTQLLSRKINLGIIPSEIADIAEIASANISTFGPQILAMHFAISLSYLL